MARRPTFVTRWDLDKTYLRSRFDTLRELVTAAFEPVEEKRAIPGAAAVLRELRAAGAYVHVLSGSPRQMRRKLEAKLRLDGVEWDELTLKPNLSNAVLLRLRALRDQLGYKLPELLSARVRAQAEFDAPEQAREVLVGDDSESDAFVYSVYADVLAGAIDWKELERILEVGRAYGRAVTTCKRAIEVIKTAPVVDRILIHLDGQTPPSHFSRYGDRLVPFYNYLQAAFILLERGLLPATAALRIASEFLTAHGFSSDTVARSYTDLLRRGHADGTAPVLLESTPTGMDGNGSGYGRTEHAELASAIQQMRHEPVPDARRAHERRTSYVDLAEHYRGGKNRRRPGQRFGFE